MSIVNAAKFPAPFVKLRIFLLRVTVVSATIAGAGWSAASVSADAASDAGVEFQASQQMMFNSRQALDAILDHMRSRPDLYLADRRLNQRMLSEDERDEIRRTWQSLLDHYIALDRIGVNGATAYKLESNDRQQSFKVGFAAFLTEYRKALEFIALAENDPTLHKLLNEAVPELGLPEGSYAEFKLRFLNVLRGTEFARLATLDSFYGKSDDTKLQAMIDTDRAALWKAGVGKGLTLTAENALQIVGDAGFTAWFPVQKSVSEWMGDAKVRRQQESLISDEMIRTLQSKLQPGDILLERREWYLSNIGLPGYWPHAALFVGTPEQRREYFQGAEIEDWLREQSQPDLESLLQSRYPAAYQLSITPQEHGHPPRVIEAMSEGVVFTTIEHSASADAVVVLRPQLSKRDKAVAIVRAYHYNGRPYDFNFDFLTDSSLVCTELVAKAYAGNSDAKGLKFPLQKIVGRYATPANEIARDFDATYGTANQQLQFVAFLDGYERENTAIERDVAAFRESWKRPKWHIIVQKKVPDADLETTLQTPVRN